LCKFGSLAFSIGWSGQIDARVYELYELTPAEIAIVEGAG